VYQIPTKSDARTDVAWALQRLFYSLQTSDTPVSTQELTRSFGWGTRQLFEQQDVQEMSRKLTEQLERRMKGTPVENAVPDLFSGKMRTYVSCINVDYETSLTEDFWDIQLNVANNRSLDDGFKDYIEVYNMVGELQFYAGEQHKLQDARKGVIFEKFPPVLHLHLKRFQYDITRGAMVKLNDYFEFPEEFDAAPYLYAGADKSEPWTYLLVGIIVHDGDINGGSYYAFLRPAKHGPFYKFSDDLVTRATLKETIQDNFGGNSMNGGYPANKASAYMLVYIRKSKLDHVLADITKKDLPEHLGTDPLTLNNNTC
jgi:ubiquitin carboxyl-terminal hydrolase 7